MKRWALISAGVILNVVEQPEAPAISGYWVEVVGAFGPGDLYDGTTFSKAP